MKFPDYPDDCSTYSIINGFKMHYLEAGRDNDETIVMLHGNPSWSFYYRHLFNALIDHYHCIAPDHIGMGLSDKPSNLEYSFTLKQRVDDLDALLKNINTKRHLTLIVHDWGGMIGLAYASRYPDKIKRLVISNTASFHLPAGKHPPWQLRLGQWPIIGALLIQGLNMFCYGAVKRCVTQSRMPGDVQAAYLAPYHSWSQRLSILKFIEDIPFDRGDISYQAVGEVDKQLHQFAQIPVLICWGLHDFIFDIDFLNEWKRRLPDAICYEYNAGHYLLEDAGDEVIPAIQSFLACNPIKN